MPSPQDSLQTPHYHTSGAYPSFPSHLAWYPEQHIHHLATASSGVARELTSGLAHYSEHYQNVEKHHRQLKQKVEEVGVGEPGEASRSILFNTLRYGHLSGAAVGMVCMLQAGQRQCFSGLLK